MRWLQLIPLIIDRVGMYAATGREMQIVAEQLLADLTFLDGREGDWERARRELRCYGKRVRSGRQQALADRRAHAMSEPAVLRDLERRRLRSLVEAHLTAADALHTDGYELIAHGYVLTKQQAYLGGVASVQLRYQVFEPVRGALPVPATRSAPPTIGGPGPAGNQPSGYVTGVGQP
jgi:hypothetical protein